MVRRRSRRSGCGWSTCSTTSSPASRPIPSFAHFLLDGQMAVVDDYLEVRPEAEDRLRRAGRVRPPGHGPVVRPARRVPRVGRDPRPQPAARPAPGRRLRRGHGRRLPARHVRPRRPDAPAPAPSSASSTPSSGGACRRPSTAAASGGRPPTAPPCGPSTCPRATATAPACPTTPRRCSTASTSSSSDQGDLLAGPVLWMNGTDHLTAPALAGPGRGRGQRAQDDVRAGHPLAGRARGRRAHRGPARTGPASCAPAPGPTCSWAWRSNRVDVKRAAAVAERALERLAEPLAALFLPADDWPEAPARRGLARGHPQHRPRLDLRLLGRRGGRRRPPPLRRGPPDRRGPGPPGGGPLRPTRWP